MLEAEPEKTFAGHDGCWSKSSYIRIFKKIFFFGGQKSQYQAGTGTSIGTGTSTGTSGTNTRVPGTWYCLLGLG